MVRIRSPMGRGGVLTKDLLDSLDWITQRLRVVCSCDDHFGLYLTDLVIERKQNDWVERKRE